MKTWGGVFQAEKLACARALGWGGAGESETQQGGQCGCSIEREGGRSHSVNNCDKGLDYSQLINVSSLSLSFSTYTMRLLAWDSYEG